MSTVRHRLPDQVLYPDLVLAGRPGQPVTRPPEGDIDEVLLVEDHQELAETVADVLRDEGIAADVARDGQAALDRSTVNGLRRDRAGPRPARRARRQGLPRPGRRREPEPGLMLTAAGSTEDRVDGLEALLGDTSEGLKARHGLPADDAEPHRHRSVRAPQLHRFCCTARSGPEPSMARMCRG
jgi:CheY-like chemotaxis protein